MLFLKKRNEKRKTGLDLQKKKNTKKQTKQKHDRGRPHIGPLFGMSHRIMKWFITCL